MTTYHYSPKTGKFERCRSYNKPCPYDSKTDSNGIDSTGYMNMREEYKKTHTRRNSRGMTLNRAEYNRIRRREAREKVNAKRKAEKLSKLLHEENVKVNYQWDKCKSVSNEVKAERIKYLKAAKNIPINKDAQRVLNHQFYKEAREFDSFYDGVDHNAAKNSTESKYGSKTNMRYFMVDDKYLRYDGVKRPELKDINLVQSVIYHPRGYQFLGQDNLLEKTDPKKLFRNGKDDSKGLDGLTLLHEELKRNGYPNGEKLFICYERPNERIESGEATMEERAEFEANRKIIIYDKDKNVIGGFFNGVTPQKIGDVIVLPASERKSKK